MHRCRRCGEAAGAHSSKPRLKRDPQIQELIAEIRSMRREQRAELREIRALLSAKAPEDTSAVVLLKAIHNAAAGLPFTSSALLLRAEMAFGECVDRGLRSAILQTIGEVNNRKFGSWIAAMEGKSVDGYRLRRAARTKKRDGVLWACDSEKLRSH